MSRGSVLGRSSALTRCPATPLPQEVLVHYRRASRVSVAAAGLTALAVLTLVGCDSGADDAGQAAGSGPSVIAPGGPGEANRTLSADEAQRQRAEDDSP